MDEIRHASVRWCREDAGERDHGTHRRRPIDVFEEAERAVLHPAPEEPYVRLSNAFRPETPDTLIVGGVRTPPVA